MRFQNLAYRAKDVVKLALDPFKIGLRCWRSINHGALLRLSVLPMVRT